MRTASMKTRGGVFSRLLSILILVDFFIVLIVGTYLALQRFGRDVQLNILEGVASNVLTAAIFTIAGIVAFIWLSVIERRQLFHFFGVTRGSLGLRVYLSRLQVQPGGTRGAEPVRQGYSGPAINKIEYDAALLLLAPFQPRALAVIPDTLRMLLSSLFVTLADVEVAIELSPGPEAMSDSLLSSSLVSCGSAVYNRISQQILNSPDAFYEFDKSDDDVRIIRARRAGAPDLPALGRMSKHELACIQRFRDPQSGVTTFLCAGLGSAATYGSVRYLVQHWRELRRTYGNAEFGLCLSFSNQAPDDLPVVEPKVIDTFVRHAPLRRAP